MKIDLGLSKTELVQALLKTKVYENLGKQGREKWEDVERSTKCEKKETREVMVHKELLNTPENGRKRPHTPRSGTSPPDPKKALSTTQRQ